MKKMKIAMLGAGSGFVMSVAQELIAHEIFNGCEFMLQDISAERLLAAEKTVDGNHGFALNNWGKIGAPKPPNRAQVALLRQTAFNTRKP